jgi:hypothetical protein
MLKRKSCKMSVIANAFSVEGKRLVDFHITVGKEHRLGQSHSHFDHIKSHWHPSSELKPLFLFVVLDESFKIALA